MWQFRLARMNSGEPDVEARADGPCWTYIEERIVAFRKKHPRPVKHFQQSDSSDDPEHVGGGSESAVRFQNRPWFGLKSRLAPLESTRDFCSMLDATNASA